MVNKNRNNNGAEGTFVDEYWWMSVLNEAEGQTPQTKHEEQKSEDVKAGATAGDVVREAARKSDSVDWSFALAVFEQDQVVNLDVTGSNRGGLLVTNAQLKGFVPISHLVVCIDKNNGPGEVRKILEGYAGKTLPLKIIECDEARGRVVFSERAAQAVPGRRLELLEDLQEGNCTEGTVTTITEFGAFVDLGGIEGLIHISELSWGRVCHPRDVVSIGQKVEVCVLQIDYERSRVALSLKRLRENPWETVENKYLPGQLVEAKITNVVSFGAFARLESGLDGLIHVTEFGSNGGHGVRPHEILSEGQQVQVTILSVDPIHQRLGLHLNEIYE